MAKSPKIIGARTEPSKQFFVDMLTRDISLYDAILDLIDNSLDGVARLTQCASDSDYADRYVHIDFDESQFSISDNCGGIPYQVALDSAFAMGRPNDKLDDNGLPAIGVYGIGMKRAIFKIGRSAKIISRSFETSQMDERVDFAVTLTEDWIASPDWDELPVEILAAEPNEVLGTTVTIRNLLAGAQGILLKSDASEDLRKKVGRHYALILERGFSIVITGPGETKQEGTVQPPDSFFELIETPDGAVSPYISSGQIGRVRFKIFAGFLQNPVVPQDKGLAWGDSDDKVRSGWSVACNDRIVMWRDRSILTNWGVNKVPTYHAQFNSIAGLVLLYGEPRDLPLTTTKAGIDISDPLYEKVLEHMATATKELTTFTNTIKQDKEAYDKLMQKAAPLRVDSLIQRSAELEPLSADSNQDFYKTNPLRLPRIVVTKQVKLKKIAFNVTPTDYRTVAEYLEMTDSIASDVGMECFNLILEDAND